MTGMCGAVGDFTSVETRLRREFSDIWTSVSTESWPRGSLSASPTTPGVYRHHAGDGWLAAADGERHTVEAVPQFVEDAVDDLSEGRSPTVPEDWRGNGALVDPDRDFVHLATEWTGTFPLYYSCTADGFAFSSHLRPLARALGADPDPLGALEFLRHGYTLAGRTPFEGVVRLLPGQSVTYHGAVDRATIQEHSTLWARPRELGISALRSTVRELWERLAQAVSTDINRPEDRYGVMMSGGWDSRTLLALLQHLVPSARILCYSHGDTDSRELELVRELSDQAGVECTVRPIDGSVWDPDILEPRFAQTENVCFPSWHAAGRRLGRSDVGSLTSGVYGPAIGGHYGVPSVREGARRILALSARFARHYRSRWAGGRFGLDESGGAKEAYRLLRVESVGSHWYLREGFEASVGDVADRINADIERSLARYESRGIRSLDAVVEAFNSEYRGSQFINAQLLSCRPDLDVAFPLIDRRVLRLATQLPLELKLHNFLNQQMLMHAAPDLLEYPMGATLVNASRPLWLQEVSRVVRRTIEDFEWRAYLASQGRRNQPRWGWVNFEFLRDGVAFSRIRESLQSDIWDMEGIHRMQDDITTFQYDRRLHPVYDQMSKVYTLDLLYR